MTPDTLLLRQIHPGFVQEGRVTSQAFRPTPKDESRLSVDDGDRVTPETAWRRFTASPVCKSAGVQGITQTDCADLQLTVIADGHPHPEHCSIDFSGLDKKAIERAAKRLRNEADRRGWLYRDVT